MAIAAQSLSHLHIGLIFHEDDTSSDDGDTDTYLSHNAPLPEELNLGLIFPNSPCFDLSRTPLCRDNDENSYSRNETGIEHQIECKSVSKLDISHETNKSDESTNIDIMTKETVNDESSIIEVIMEITKVSTSLENYTCVRNNNNDNDTTVVKDNMDDQGESVTISSNSINVSFGKQTRRVSKRERQARRDRDREKLRIIDPSEIGFTFVCTRSLLIITDETSIHDTNSEEMETVSCSAPDSTTAVSDIVSDDASTFIADDKQELQSESNKSDALQLQDDESFFAEIGIDINDSGSFEWNDYLDWDGLTFSPPKLKCDSSSTKLKSNNTKDDKKAKNNTSVAIINTSFELNNSTPNYRMSTNEQTRLFNLECTSSQRMYLRKDKHRKKEKLHKAVKTPHCTDLNMITNPGGKRIYMHHRVLQKANIDIDFRFFGRKYNIPPMPKSGVDLTVAKAIRVKAVPSRKPPPAQNLRHVLHETNVPQTFENDLTSFLLSIQNRDLTPEDYEMLLRLDDTVKAKTVSKDVLATLKAEPVGEDIADILNCVICMEPYLIGQTRKFLPCDHDFHSDCIDSWLANNSQNCPLDGLPITDS